LKQAKEKGGKKSTRILWIEKQGHQRKGARKRMKKTDQKIE